MGKTRTSKEKTSLKLMVLSMPDTAAMPRKMPALNSKSKNVWNLPKMKVSISLPPMLIALSVEKLTDVPISSG